MVDPSMSVQHVAAPIRDQVLNNVRQAIIEQRFKPGRRLIERELVDMTGASRTSVREALRQLAAEGLVQTIPHKGTIVSSPTRQEAEELYEVRSLLESLEVRRFVEHATPDQLSALVEAFRVLESMDDVQDMLRAKENFYRVLGSCSTTVYSILSILRARVSVLRAISLSEPTRVPDSIREMRELVDAILARDGDRAARLSAEHVEHASIIALRALDGSAGVE